MSKQEDAKELTFHLALLQVIQNRMDALAPGNSWVKQGVKQANTRFIAEIDKKVTLVYPKTNDEEINELQVLTEQIDAQLDLAQEWYLNKLTNEETD